MKRVKTLNFSAWLVTGGLVSFLVLQSSKPIEFDTIHTSNHSPTAHSTFQQADLARIFQTAAPVISTPTQRPSLQLLAIAHASHDQDSSALLLVDGKIQKFTLHSPASKEGIQISQIGKNHVTARIQGNEETLRFPKGK